MHPNGGQDSGHEAPSGRAEGASRRPVVLVLLAIVLGMECALLLVVSIYLLVSLVVETPAFVAMAVAELVLALLATLWLAVLSAQALRRRPWVRAAAMMWQIVQLAIGVSNLQGEYARPDIGWLLIVPAAAGIWLLFTGSVKAQLSHPHPEG